MDDDSQELVHMREKPPSHDNGLKQTLQKELQIHTVKQFMNREFVQNHRSMQVHKFSALLKTPNREFLATLFVSGRNQDVSGGWHTLSHNH